MKLVFIYSLTVTQTPSTRLLTNKSESEPPESLNLNRYTTLTGLKTS